MDRKRTSFHVAIVFAILAILASFYLETSRNFFAGKWTFGSALSRPARYLKVIAHDDRTQVTYLGKSYDGVDHFQNIFYAGDTSGKNRFAPPVPYKPASGSGIDATEPGAWCPQGTGDILPFTSHISNVSENCLSLRVARPSGTKQDAKFPVMVWLHSGGNVLGSASEKLYRPDKLVKQAVADNQPIVYVAINYRLGVFGFAMSAALQEAKQTNVGFRDQQLAFKWVKNNIATFGGDPNNVTAFGHSVGGLNVGLHLLAHGGERGAPFQKGIMMSGSPGLMLNMGSDLTQNNTAQIFEKLGCAKDGNSQSAAALSCMRGAAFEDVLQTSLRLSREARPPFGELYFPNVVDGDVFPDRPSQLTRAGRFVKGVSLIASWTANEGAWYALPTITRDDEIMDGLSLWLPRLSSETQRKLLHLYPLSDFESMVRPGYDGPISPQYYRAAQMSRDIFFTCPILDFTWQYVKNGGANSSNVRLAEHNSTRYAPVFEKMGVPMWRVSHLSDIPYVFNGLLDGGADNSPSQLELAKLESSSLVRFASLETPVGSKTGVEEWPLAYDSVSRKAGKGILSALTLKLWGGQHGTQTIHVSENASRGLAAGGGEQAVLDEKLFKRCEFINNDQFRLEAGV